ncbi:MAG: transposase, partial [Gluconacetobacter sp.]
MEIITGVERRRRWSLEEKLRLVAECDAPDSSVTRVSRQHDISRALLWTWRRQLRRGELGGGPDRGFLSVTL